MGRMGSYFEIVNSRLGGPYKGPMALTLDYSSFCQVLFEPGPWDSTERRRP